MGWVASGTADRLSPDGGDAADLDADILHTHPRPPRVTREGPVMKTIEINGVTEQIIERSDWPVERQRAVLADEVTAVLGYGPQGRGQSLNLRDQGLNVLVGVRPGPSREKAVADGWEEGENLISIEDAAEQGSIVQYLLSDAAQIAMWPETRKRLGPGDCLYFSHG